MLPFPREPVHGTITCYFPKRGRRRKHSFEDKDSFEKGTMFQTFFEIPSYLGTLPARRHDYLVRPIVYDNYASAITALRYMIQ